MLHSEGREIEVRQPHAKSGTYPDVCLLCSARIAQAGKKSKCDDEPNDGEVVWEHLRAIASHRIASQPLLSGVDIEKDADELQVGEKR